LTTRYYISILLLFLVIKGYTQSEIILLESKLLKEIPNQKKKIIQKSDTTPKTTVLTTWITPEVAEKSDLQNGVTLFYYRNSNLTRKDRRFAKKYKIKYVTRGCIRLPDEDPKGYNLIILRRLEEKYGTKVLKELRTDLY
jgi:hypothetical protein